MHLSKSDSKLPELTVQKSDIQNETHLIINSNSTNKRFSPFLRQVFASAGPIIGTIAAGTTSGYSAILLPQLQRNSSEIQITQNEATWIASMAALPMAAGCIVGGVLMERYGRRMTHLILSIPYMVGWILIATASSLMWILLGRFLSGFCVGILGPPASVFIGETSGPKYRGILLAGISFAIALGILISHGLGTYLDWKTTAFICGVLPLLCYLSIYFVPESPSWLLSQGDVEKAADSFLWLRGHDQEAVDELKDLIKKQSGLSSSSSFSWEKIKGSYNEPSFLRPLFIILTFFFMMQFCGINAIAFYSVSIMKNTIGDGLNEYMATFVIDIVRLIMSTVACILLRNVGRRPLAIISAIGTAVSLFGLSSYLFWSANLEESMKMAWLPLMCLICYICFTSIGVVPLPWCMTGELFPLSIRGLGSGISSSWNFLIFFIVVKTGPVFFTEIGPEGAFLIYGCVAFVGTIFLYFFLPETKNKTLQEIEEGFKKKKTNTTDKV